MGNKEEKIMDADKIEMGAIRQVTDTGGDILKVHILYLEKLEKLNQGERNVFIRYIDCLGGATPVIEGLVDTGIEKREEKR
jgi:hypothetical protein